MRLAPGWYLVGRRDGSVEPKLEHGWLASSGNFLTAGPRGHPQLGRWYGKEVFWFERQEIPDTVPETWPMAGEECN